MFVQLVPQENPIAKTSEPLPSGREFDLACHNNLMTLGVFMMIIGGYFAFALVVAFPSISRGGLNDLLPCIALSLLLPAGCLLYQVQWRQIGDLSREQSILAAAKACNGKLTVADAVLHGSVRITDAQRLLDRLALNGLCEVEATDSGQLVYTFQSFLPSGQIEAPTNKQISTEEQR